MELINQILPIVLLVLQALGGLVLVATVVARLTPTPKDDQLVTTAYHYWLKVIHFLPTLGVNPQTAALMKALEEVKLPPTPEEGQKP